MVQPNPIGNAIKEEIKKSGSPPVKKDTNFYETDEIIFKSQVLNPIDPVFYEEQTWINPSNPEVPIKTIVKRGQIVSTMALGNFTSREVRGINSLMSISRICERNGYNDISAGCQQAYVHRVVASQCIEFKLGTMLLTNLNALYRKEEFPPMREEEDGQKSNNPIGAIFDKIKSMDKKKQSEETRT
jgi:hypothetical protein